MKIIATDNFDQDHVDDILIAENIRDKEGGSCMVEALNKKYCNWDGAPYYYILVEDNYKLKKFEP